MKQSRRGLATGLLAAGTLVVAVGLSACGSSSNMAVGPATPGCPNGVLTLSLLRADQGVNPPGDDQVAMWEKNNPCTKIAVTKLPYSQLEAKINILASSSDAPDLYSYNSPNTGQYASQGILAPLNDYIPAGFLHDVLPITSKENTFEGKLYSPGVTQVALAMYYNKTLTDKLGIQPPSSLDQAWTWPQAIDAMRKCQQGPSNAATVWGFAPSWFGNGTPGTAYRDLPFLRSAGDPNAPKDSSAYKTFWSQSEDGKTADGYLNSPEAIEAAKVYQSLYLGPTQVTPATGNSNTFQQGQACFALDLNGNYKAITQASKFEVGVTPMPYFKTPIVQTGNTELGVSSQSKHIAEAAKFAFDMASDGYATSFANDSGAFPVRTSLYPQVPAMNQAPLTIFRDELTKWGQPRPPSAQYPQYDEVVTTALRDIAYGADPKTRLDQAVSDLKPILGG